MNITNNSTTNKLDIQGVNMFDRCSENKNNKDKTCFYHWTISPKYSSDFNINEVVNACVLSNTQEMVYFIEKHKKGTQHVHGIGYTGSKGRANKISIQQTEKLNNETFDRCMFRIGRCWDPSGWASYMQKDGGFEMVYPADNPSPKWWKKYRVNLPSKEDDEKAYLEVKEENAKEKIIFRTLEGWLNEHQMYMDLDSMMAYARSKVPGVYIKVLNPEGKHLSFVELINTLFSKFNIAGIKNKEATVSAIVNDIRGYTADDIVASTFNVKANNTETSIADSLQKYCIKLMHTCVRFEDFALEPPYSRIITDPLELSQLCTIHYLSEINLDNRIEYATKFKDSSAPICSILRANNQFNKEALYTLYRAMGKRLGPKHLSIHNCGVSNGGKSTLCEYPKAFLPKKAYSTINKEVEGEFSLAPFVDALKLFVEEADKFLSGCGPTAKIILEGGELDIPMKNKNFSKELKNSHVAWLNSNITKNSDDWLYNPAIINRLFNFVFTVAYTVGNGEDSASIVKEIQENKMYAMNFLHCGSELFEDKNKTVWSDVEMYDIPQQEKRDMLIDMHSRWHKKLDIPSLDDI